MQHSLPGHMGGHLWSVRSITSKRIPSSIGESELIDEFPTFRVIALFDGRAQPVQLHGDAVVLGQPLIGLRTAVLRPERQTT